MTTAEVRNRLRLAGYSPIPVNGKTPAPTAWQQKLQTNPNEIMLWEKTFPDALNTGILTRITPTLDIDILNPEAAIAVEELARARFEERGYILVRIGKAPKRAIPFRTDAPFKKIVCDLVSPSQKPEKLELLADGQQVVVFGIHKDTGKPYSWHGGEPGKIKWEDLPFVSANEARSLIRDAEQLLITQYGYCPVVPRPKEPAGGQDWTPAPASSWRALVRNGVAEGARNQSISKLAGHFLRRYVDPVVTLEMMTVWNAARCKPPLSDDEVQIIVNSIAGREIKRRDAGRG
jgi:hypothetical protein